MTHLPKHLLWLVARSMKTLEDMTLPKGMNICMSSPSPNSWGRVDEQVAAFGSWDRASYHINQSTSKHLNLKYNTQVKMLVLDEFRSSQYNDFDPAGEPPRVSEYAHIALFSFFPILVWMRFWWMKMKTVSWPFLDDNLISLSSHGNVKDDLLVMMVNLFFFFFSFNKSCGGIFS